MATLVSLSKVPSEMSSETRRELLNAVTDLFLLDQDPSELSKEHYGEIASHSLSHLGSSERQAYAEQVAAVPSLPHQVAVTLAGDQDGEVARLVLKLSPVLTDADLAAIALSQSQYHLVAIAERTQLSPGLTDILVERGNRDVLHTVSNNDGASFSDKGFDKLLERGGDDIAISSALAARADLTPDRAARVMRIVEELNDSGGLWSKRPDEAVTLARQARQQRLEVKLLLSDLSAGTRTLDDVVAMLANEDRAYHLAQVLAQAAEISTEQALRALMQRNVSAIAVTCRALGVSSQAFEAVLTMRVRRLYFATKNIKDDLRGYVTLDAPTAERTMRFLKMRTKLR